MPYCAVLYSAKCGADWEERPNSNYCYQYHDEVKNHADALATCNRYGGSLVSVTDHVEQSYLAGMCVGVGVWMCVVGGYVCVCVCVCVRVQAS